MDQPDRTLLQESPTGWRRAGGRPWARGSPHNEINAGNPFPNFIQLDLSSILSQGFTNGMIAVSSLQNGESFQLFGSNFQGVLGTSISGPFTGLAFDNQFVAIPSFGTFQFISVVAASGNVLPSQFMATPIPEMGTVLPIIALLVAVGSTSLLRRRRAAQLGATAESSARPFDFAGRPKGTAALFCTATSARGTDPSPIALPTLPSRVTPSLRAAGMRSEPARDNDPPFPSRRRPQG